MCTPVKINTARADTPFLSSRLERVFDACFASRLNTRLQGGAAEPLYQPANAVQRVHLLYYREDFFASALHEIAHWCIAGPERRLKVDFGYWYAPDGRNDAQQQAFEAVECKPQGLEWFFSKACDYRFRLSVDNLEGSDGSLPDTTAFQGRVLAQVAYWQQNGLPERAALFYAALCREFGTSRPAAELCFDKSDLQ